MVVFIILLCKNALESQPKQLTYKVNDSEDLKAKTKKVMEMFSDVSILSLRNTQQSCNQAFLWLVPSWTKKQSGIVEVLYLFQTFCSSANAVIYFWIKILIEEVIILTRTTKIWWVSVVYCSH